MTPFLSTNSHKSKLLSLQYGVPRDIFGKFRKGFGGHRGLARGDPPYARDSDHLLFTLSPTPRFKG